MGVCIDSRCQMKVIDIHRNVLLTVDRPACIDNSLSMETIYKQLRIALIEYTTTKSEAAKAELERLQAIVDAHMEGTD